MKNLPVGIQTLPKIREKNCIYVDKTQLVHKLVTQGSFYFLSRPRRFGKSLLVSTLKELYLGNKAVFEGLWIENNWDWSKTNPVLDFSFDKYGYGELGLLDTLKSVLRDKAKDFGIELTKTDLKGMFAELIKSLDEKQGKVVLLIDEYDKPILDFLEENRVEQAKANREVLRDFYGVLKSSDMHLQMVFITGISKFSKVSIFSHLNNLDDITLNKKYATLTGYTHEELEYYFEDYLKVIEKTLSLSHEVLMDNMRIWYNGYSWDGVNRVYNPFGTLQFLSNEQFRNFWFATGSPRFLIQQMRKHSRFDFENTTTNSATLDKYDLDNLELVPLLFQAGYLTIKEADVMSGDLILDYPNQEVRESMYQFLIDDLAQNPYRTHTGRTIKDLNHAFLSKDLNHVKSIINAILADLPSETYQKQSEGLYHGLIHLIFSYLGMFIDSEVHSSQGRADAVVQTLTDIYIFEFKFNKTAQEAIDQIHDRHYATKYQASGKTITGVGVNFNSEMKQIDDWAEEMLNPKMLSD
jgi:Predicted AAA-ATPase/PD-(D/E)XK nuclease superfamily